MAEEIDSQDVFINHVAIAIYLADHPDGNVEQLNDALAEVEGHNKKLAKVLNKKYLPKAESVVDSFDLTLYSYVDDDGYRHMRVEGGWL